MLLSVDRPDGGAPLEIAGNPIKLSGGGPTPKRRWPTLGEHTESVLRDELALDETEIEALRERGVVA